MVKTPPFSQLGMQYCLGTINKKGIGSSNIMCKLNITLIKQYV
jgi:hypothetical protein